GRLTGEQRENLDVFLVEGIELRTLEIEDTNAAILQEQRDRQLRTAVFDHLDVARIDRDVRHEHRLLVQRRVPDDALPQLHAWQIHLVAVPHRAFDLEEAGVFVEQQN